jgi:hypothetical protein
LGTDLNAPLGQNRKTRSPKTQKSGLTFGRLSLAIGVLALAGISAWTLMRPSGLITPPKPETQGVADASAPG